MTTTKNQEETERTPTLEESTLLAGAIVGMTGFLSMMDVPYAAIAAKAMREEASRYDSLAVLNRAYDPTNSELLNAQAEVLETIVKLRKQLMEITQLKGRLLTNEALQQRIANLFL